MVRQGFLRALAAIAIFVGAGYLSSWASQGSCRRYLARRAIDDFKIPKGMSIPIFALPREEESFKTLASVGVQAQRCAFQERPGEVFDCFPWVSVEKIAILGPYVVQADWASIAFPTSGGGTHTTMIAVFGFVVPISDRGGWVS